MNVETALIALDWGSTALRAYRMDAEGRILERVASERGITAGGEFERTLREEAGAWLSSGAAIVAGGMITSRQGWVETPYAPCPAGLEDLARGLVAKTFEDGLTIHFVPGLSTRRRSAPDVIRGEEAQIIGAAGDRSDGLYVLPGTHSKWARVEKGRVTDFATFVTGELYAALRKHTLIGRMMVGETSAPEAFALGFKVGLEEGGLLGSLFGARTLGLFGDVAAEDLGDYLSGLLVGAEIREGSALYPEVAEGVVLVGGAALSERYGRAFALSGRRAQFGIEDAAAYGLWRIAKAAGLI